MVPSVPLLQPAEEWLHEDEEEQGREGVSLERSPVYRYAVCTSLVGAYSCCSSLVEILDYVDYVGRATDLLHDLL